MPRFSAIVLLLTAISALVITGCPPIVPANPGPQARFTVDNREGTAPLTVRFTDASAPGKGTILSWEWDFGDGSKSSARNPVHKYTRPFQAGTGSTATGYTVSLTVSTIYGEDTWAVENFVRVIKNTTTDSMESSDQDSTGYTEIESANARVAVWATALDDSRNISITEDAPPFAFTTSERLQRVSGFYYIQHNGGSDAVYSVREDGSIRPAILEFAFKDSGYDPGKVHILAQLDNGLLVPVFGKIENGVIRAEVMRLPRQARYVVVYRPDSETIFAEIPAAPAGKQGAGRVTPPAWPADSWRVVLSDFLLQQLTALRLGDIADSDSFAQAAYTRAQLDATTDEMLAAIVNIHAILEASGMRSPLLVKDTENNRNRFTLFLFNMSQPPALTTYDLQGVCFGENIFGQIVLDPNQLIRLAERNAAIFAGNPGNPDPAQKWPVESLFTSELLDAVASGYALPDIRVESQSDFDRAGNPEDVHFFAGIREGLKIWLGQYAGNIPFARGFAENEYMVLSEPLFMPVHPETAGYASAAQEFFSYIGAVNAADDPLAWIGAFYEPADYNFDPLPAGLLQETRFLVRGRLENTGGLLDINKLLPWLYQAADNALAAWAGTTLADIYWEFVLDRAIENTVMLHPADEAMAAETPFVFREEYFSTDAVITRSIDVPTTTVTISSAANPPLQDIAPMSSIAVVLEANPLVNRLSLSFDRSGWNADEDGNSLNVAVYVEGEGFIAELGANENEITIQNLFEEFNAMKERIIILVSNVSLNTESTFSMTARSRAGLEAGRENDVLRNYIAAEDATYDYNLLMSYEEEVSGAAMWWLEMTSGAWRNASEIYEGATNWRHNLAIVEPPRITSDTAMLIISGGSTGSEISEDDILSLMLPFSLSTGSVVAHIQAVPNQPLRFAGEITSRSEDATIAYSYDKYLDQYEAWYNCRQDNPDNPACVAPDVTWPVLLPMARAAHRAMDTVQQFMQVRPGSVVMINDFLVAGASKRGWTTWLTGAADAAMALASQEDENFVYPYYPAPAPYQRRVKALVPIVINVLDMENQIQHHYQAYGGHFSTSIGDYYAMNIFERFDTPWGESLLQIVDPWSYRDILTMPKLIVSATGDQFFLPDALVLQSEDPGVEGVENISGIAGENRVYFAPNSDHGLTDDADNVNAGTLNSVLSFYNTVCKDLERPDFSWPVNWNRASGTFTVTADSDQDPFQVRLWTAVNPDYRDFRNNPRNINGGIPPGTIGPQWTYEVLLPGSGNQYTAQIDEPEEGWLGFFVQAVYNGYQTSISPGLANEFGIDRRPDIIFSTPVYVVPDCYPPNPAGGVCPGLEE
jgi:PhoPQ-activated pathogenicity-related protein